MQSQVLETSQDKGGNKWLSDVKKVRPMQHSIDKCPLCLQDWTKCYTIQQLQPQSVCLFHRAPLPQILYMFVFFLITLLIISRLTLLSSDSGSYGQKRLASATSAAGTAVAASEAAGSLEAPTWAWTSSSLRSWHPPPRPHSPLPALSRTCLMASLCYSQGSGLLPRKHPKWTVWLCKELI